MNFSTIGWTHATKVRKRYVLFENKFKRFMRYRPWGIAQPDILFQWEIIIYNYQRFVYALLHLLYHIVHLLYITCKFLYTWLLYIRFKYDFNLHPQFIFLALGVSNLHLKYTELAKKYGPVLTVYLGVYIFYLFYDYFLNYKNICSGLPM